MPIAYYSSSIVISDPVLSKGETSTVTFTFSEAVTDFTISDLQVANGALSNLNSADDGVTWTATLTPSDNVEDSTNVIALDLADVRAVAGGASGFGTLTSSNYVIDGLRPTVSISLADQALGIGQTSGVTFTFSEAVTGFDLSALTVDNGALSGLSTSDNIVYTATLTPADDVTDTSNIIRVDLTGVSDQAGNAGAGSTDSPNYVVDDMRPTATIVMADTALKAGETSEVTITFSEAVTGFGSDDLSIPNGAISVLNSSDGGVTWRGTFTPDEDVRDTTNLITLNNAGLTDLVGNMGTGTTSSANFTIDTVQPTASIVVADTALRIGETTNVTLTFSEAVTGLTLSDLSVQNGVLSNLSTSDSVTWTATLTPSTNVQDSSNLVSLDLSGVTAVAGGGNTGSGTVDSNNYAIDTARPTASVTVANALLQAGQTSQVTIAFSEAVSGFTTLDMTVANGALSNLVSTDGGVTWTATLTPSVGVVDATNLIELDATGVADLVGNVGVGVATSNNYEVGYTPLPTQIDYNDRVVMGPGDSTGVVVAGIGNDTVVGNNVANTIQGNAGDDSVSGGGGNDLILGGQGNDLVQGNTGNDQLYGDRGNDSLFGGKDDDFIQGGLGVDYVIGDLGNDTVLGGQGDDVVIGMGGDDYLSGDLGDDRLQGGPGADIFNFVGGGGNDIVFDFSQAQHDRIRISTADAADFGALSSKLFGLGGNSVAINLDSQTIQLFGVAKSALSAADFVFV